MRTVAVILGEAIREAREELGLSQAQLARERGKAQAWLSYIEAGKREPCLGDLDYLLWRCQLVMPLDEYDRPQQAEEGTA